MKKNETEDEEVMVLYEWVDSMPLSRLKKSINRDFSDAVLMAEVLKYLYPRLVNLHNYPEVHSTKQKIYNWQTLNDKVFKKKIEMIKNLSSMITEKSRKRKH